MGGLTDDNPKLAENIVVSNNRVHRNSRLINESLVYSSIYRLSSKTPASQSS